MAELTQQDIQEFKQQGYTEEEIQMAIQSAEAEESGMGMQGVEQDPKALSQHSAFMTKPEESLIKWQLELNDILERTEHILRGDVPTYVNGVMIWGRNPNPELNPLSDWGIQEIMKILAMYINRNTILADYDNSEINWKVFDFGRRLNNLFFMKYDEMGMDTENKRKAYEMIIGELVDIVHSAYKRALHGGERRSLREMINITQSHQTAGMGGQPQIMMPKERSILNPARYVKGKYV